MLQPGGSKLGYDLPDEALATMTDQEKQRYEQDLIMRGFGNKCLQKFLETMVMAAISMLILYYTGGLEKALHYMNPGVFDKKISDDLALDHNPEL